MNGHSTPKDKDADANEGKRPSPSSPPLYSIPCSQRPTGYGSWWSKILFPLLFDLGILGINSVQFLFVPLLLVPIIGHDLFRRAIDWTKDGFGRLLIAITVLFAPTSLVITTDGSPELDHLVDRDTSGNVVRVNLPDRLVLMSNHQAYLDWMYLWMLACYAGHAEGITILLKASLKHVPFVGWGMQFFRFIFLHRSWAADKDNLARSLQQLAAQAKTVHRSPLWLLIFPEGTITSDNERAKSVRYAEKQQIDDFVGVLHPRSTGLLFCLRTLTHAVPDLKLLDITIGYPGVPFGSYPQEWYGLGSVFWRGVSPPLVRIHLKLYDLAPTAPDPVPSLSSSGEASPEEARAFELWLRGVWEKKEDKVRHFARLSATAVTTGQDEMAMDLNPEQGPCEVVPIRQLSIDDWVAAFGGGGIATAALAARAIKRRFF